MTPRLAEAQSAIVGVVKDTSGAVLPGVTVEAVSDVLIGQGKSATTGAGGTDRIADLRPGTYSVTFTGQDFNTFRRDDLRLTAEFTATTDATLSVGALEETVAVPLRDRGAQRARGVPAHLEPRDGPRARTGTDLGFLGLGRVVSRLGQEPHPEHQPARAPRPTP
jgi:hypothetical protein